MFTSRRKRALKRRSRRYVVAIVLKVVTLWHFLAIMILLRLVSSKLGHYLCFGSDIFRLDLPLFNQQLVQCYNFALCKVSSTYILLKIDTLVAIQDVLEYTKSLISFIFKKFCICTLKYLKSSM